MSTNDEYVIIFIDKTKKWISKQIADNIFLKSYEPGCVSFTLDNDFYFRLSHVAKIVSKEEYYQLNPQERPDTIKNFQQPDLFEKPPPKPKKVLNGLIKGLENYINNQSQQPEKAKTILKQMKEKLNCLTN